MLNSHLKVLYILRGVSGTGKTTLAEYITPHSFAADDLPGLYDEKGKYNVSLQSQSHYWCFQQIEKLLESGASPVAVNNTFISKKYLDQYFELARKYGYAAAVVKTEGIILPDGSKTDSKVSKKLKESQLNRWEPLFSPPKLGISSEEIADNLKELKTPIAVVSDWDGTLIKGELFPENPCEFTWNTQANPLVNLPEETKLFLVSNQRGISSGQRSLPYLKERWECFKEKSLVNFDKALFATHREAGNYLECTEELGLRERVLDCKADKPNPGLFKVVRRSLCEGSFTPANEQVWVIGDGHSNQHSDDYQFFLNIRKSEPFYDVRYIPVEFLAVASALALK